MWKGKRNVRKYTSDKIANLSWICSILVVLIHAGTYAFNIPGSETATIYGKNISTFIQMFFAEGVCRVAVPLFFIFSGFLFFQNFELTPACVGKKFQRRVFSLVIPYLFWSGGTFLFFYIAQSVPATAVYFSSRPVVGIGLEKTLNYILLDSLNSPLWYLRNLIILTVFTPLIYVLIKKLWYIALPAACVCGILGIGVLSLRGSAICTFCIGSFLAIQGDMLSGIWEKLTHYKKTFTTILSAAWLILLIGKACYLCTLPVSVLLTGRYPAALNILNIINVILGVPAMWLLYDVWAAKREVKRTNSGTHGMMVYAMHHPLIAIVKKVLLMILGSSMWLSLLCYFASAAITIGIALLLSKVLQRYVYGFYSLISGGR